MSAKSLMVNEGMLQELETRIIEIRKMGGELVKAMSNPKAAFSEGVGLLGQYADSLEVLREVSKMIFEPYDLVDPEDNELQRREEEDEEDDEGEDEDDEDEEGDEEDEEEPT